jgi:outer membrane biosynthesis protein TonB
MMFGVINLSIRFLIIAFFILSLSVVNAAELYISKNVRMHTEASLESPVTNLLLGGKKVEVLRIDGDFTEVQDEADNVGWIASEFLSDIEPASSNKAVIEKKENATSSTKVAKKQEKAKPKPLVKKKEKKKQNKKQQNKKQPKAAQKAKTTSKNSPSALADNKKKLETDSAVNASKQLLVSEVKSKQLLEQMQNENQQLKSQLEQIRNIINTTAAPSDNNYSQYFTDKTLWMLIGGILVGFILGLLWNDFNLRRRHGGYKV